jgi:hypothetical protein
MPLACWLELPTPSACWLDFITPLAFWLEFANGLFCFSLPRVVATLGWNLPTPLAFCGNGLTDKTREKA